MDILDTIKSCKTRGELDFIRPRVAEAMLAGDHGIFITVQKAFIRQINKLKRIPLAKRGSDFYDKRAPETSSERGV